MVNFTSEGAKAMKEIQQCGFIKNFIKSAFQKAGVTNAKTVLSLIHTYVTFLQCYVCFC